MTPREALRLAASLLSLAPGAAARRLEEVVAWTGIPTHELDRPVGRSGVGVAQRTGLACALIGDPEVLLLDEPLRALDATERTRLLRVPGPRRTMLLASRYPASEAGLVSHVALLRAGRIAMVAPVTELTAAGLPLSMHGISALADRRGTPARRELATSAVATR
jgi:ABC-2 type transport system ATP-binding protein